MALLGWQCRARPDGRVTRNTLHQTFAGPQSATTPAGFVDCKVLLACYYNNAAVTDGLESVARELAPLLEGPQENPQELTGATRWLLSNNSMVVIYQTVDLIESVLHIPVHYFSSRDKRAR
jgi:hypothetical protein